MTGVQTCALPILGIFLGFIFFLNNMTLSKFSISYSKIRILSGLYYEIEIFYIKKVCIASLAATYSPVPQGKVPLALWGFTSEFGMGSSVSPTL